MAYGPACAASGLGVVPHNPAVNFKPLVTPLACAPFFIHHTRGFGPARRRRTAWIASVMVFFVVIAASALPGLQILPFFGSSLGGFQVGGGMLLLAALAGVVMADGLVSQVPLLGGRGVR